jgi:hypothetical protein
MSEAYLKSMCVHVCLICSPVMGIMEVQLTVGSEVEIFVSENPSDPCFPSTVVVVPAIYQLYI